MIEFRCVAQVVHALHTPEVTAAPVGEAKYPHRADIRRLAVVRPISVKPVGDGVKLHSNT